MNRQIGITCDFKSGIILKNKVILSPMYNLSHSRLLDRLKIEDTQNNAMRVFVKALLSPPNGNVLANIEEWKFKVDQDIVPEWFEIDKYKYEEEMRISVSKFIKDNFVQIADLLWTPIKQDNGKIFYLLFNPLFKSNFGSTNNYAISEIREKINNGSLSNLLKEMFKDRLIPISLDLTSMDGLKDYKYTNNDILSLLNLDLYRENRENIPITDSFWLATPDSTYSGLRDDLVRCVDSIGSVRCEFCDKEMGVRPYFILSL